MAATLLPSRVQESREPAVSQIHQDTSLPADLSSRSEGMMPRSTMVNVFVTTIPGMRLPKTLCIPVPISSSISDVAWLIHKRVYQPDLNITLYSSDGKIICRMTDEPIDNPQPITTLMTDPEAHFLNMRLGVPMCGGKGGFGSQLRAAGGKMSSRRKKKQGEVNGSNRNLDGRRLRTVNEAKALAEYLAIKPDMDKKEKEERRKRWEAVVEMTERKQEEIKSGGKTRLDGKWVEAKEEATEKTREAVIAALSAGEIPDIMRESDTSESGSEESDSEEAEGSSYPQKKALASNAAAPRSFFGWDEDEDMSDSEDEVEETAEESATAHEDKGKGKGKS